MGMQSTLEVRETYNLIGSDKVEGTPVFRPTGERIGHITRVMINKFTGKVAYAVLSFGGFLGLGADYYPLPWHTLTYNEALGGYEVNIPEQRLQGAPHYAETDAANWKERLKALDDYYGVPAVA